MATFIKGNAVANATSYELLEKVGGDYNKLTTASEINFNLDELTFPVGQHIIVVKAKADGFEDSDYSNEVVFNNAVGSVPILSLTGSVLHDNSVYNYNETTTPPTYTFTEDTSKAYYCFDLVPVRANASYRVQYGRYAFFLDANKNVIGKRVSFTADYTDWTFTTPENCAYISVSLKYAEAAPENALLEAK